jgi:hypothetical protein
MRHCATDSCPHQKGRAVRPATEEGASEQRLAVGPAGRPGEPARGDRYQRRAHRPCLRLLAGRQGQLRRRPGRRRARHEGRPERAGGRAREPGVPGPESWFRLRISGRHPAVPRHRHRDPRRRQHPRGGAGLGARVPRRLCGQRPDRPRACPCPADQRVRGGHRVLRGGPAERRRDRPGRGRHARLHQAGGGDADRGPAVHPR